MKPEPNCQVGLGFFFVFVFCGQPHHKNLKRCFCPIRRCSPSGVEATDHHGGEAVQPLRVCGRHERRGPAAARRRSGSEDLHIEDPRRYLEGSRRRLTEEFVSLKIPEDNELLVACGGRTTPRLSARSCRPSLRSTTS